MRKLLLLIIIMILPINFDVKAMECEYNVGYKVRFIIDTEDISKSSLTCNGEKMMFSDFNKKEEEEVFINNKCGLEKSRWLKANQSELEEEQAKGCPDMYYYNIHSTNNDVKYDNDNWGQMEIRLIDRVNGKSLNEALDFELNEIENIKCVYDIGGRRNNNNNKYILNSGARIIISDDEIFGGNNADEGSLRRRGKYAIIYPSLTTYQEKYSIEHNDGIETIKFENGGDYKCPALGYYTNDTGYAITISFHEATINDDKNATIKAKDFYYSFRYKGEEKIDIPPAEITDIPISEKAKRNCGLYSYNEYDKISVGISDSTDYGLILNNVFSADVYITSRVSYKNNVVGGNSYELHYNYELLDCSQIEEMYYCRKGNEAYFTKEKKCDNAGDELVKTYKKGNFQSSQSGNWGNKYKNIDKCTDIDVQYIKACGCIPAEVADITSKIYFILMVAGPGLLLIIGGFEMAKAISAQDESAIEKAKKKLINKFIAAVAIFLVLIVIKFIVGIVGADSDSIMECVEILLNGYVI